MQLSEQAVKQKSWLCRRDPAPRGTGSWPSPSSRATCPFWGLLPHHGHLTAVLVTSATAEGCEGRQESSESSRWPRDPGNWGWAVHRRALGRRGRIPDDHAHHLSCAVSRANSVSNPAPHHCLFLRGLNCCGHTEWVGQECPGPALCRGSPSSLQLTPPSCFWSQAEFPILHMTEEPASDLPGVGIDRNRHLDH